MKKIIFYLIIFLIILSIVFLNYKSFEKTEDDIYKDVVEYQNDVVKQSNIFTMIVLSIIFIVFFIFWKKFFK